MNLDRSQAPNPYLHLPEVDSFDVRSDDIAADEPLADRFAGQEGVSPHLAWSDVPSDTESIAISCFDPDAPTPSGFWHWMMVGLDPGTREVLRDAGRPTADLPGGAFVLRNDAGFKGFVGAMPPPGDFAHRYMFAVHALDTANLPLNGDASPAYASFQMVFHTLARGLIVATYAVPAA